MLQERILTFTIFAELAHDLQFDSDVVWGYEGGPPWAGWTEDSMGQFVGLDEPVQPGRRPDCRFFFRDAPSVGIASRQVVEAAFADWIEPYGSESHEYSAEPPLDESEEPETSDRSTVAAVALYVPGAGLPSDSEAEEYMTKALGLLGEFLTSLGMGGNDVLLGPVAVSDLPGRIPWTATVTRPGRKRVRSSRGQTIAHEWRPEVLDQPRPRHEIELAGSLFRAQRDGEEPSFAVFELSHAARREALAGRYGPAVITAGTAIEVLVEIVLKKNWTASGLDSSELAEALTANPATRVRDYLPRVLAVSVDVSDPSTPPGRWHANAYLLRNRVAHRGYRPTLDETHEALDATYAFVVFIGAALDARPETAGRAGKIPTGRVRSQRYAFLGE